MPVGQRAGVCRPVTLVLPRGVAVSQMGRWLETQQVAGRPARAAWVAMGPRWVVCAARRSIFPA